LEESAGSGFERLSGFEAGWYRHVRIRSQAGCPWSNRDKLGSCCTSKKASRSCAGDINIREVDESRGQDHRSLASFVNTLVKKMKN
jgi:hypothetical protein